VYYIRNSEAGTFFAGGNAWGTRLSLKSAGDRVKVTRIGETDGYTFNDASLLNQSTGNEIGEPTDGSLDLFIDQHNPNGGYKFHKLTAEEIATINKEDVANFGKGIDQTYYFIYYTNHNGKTVYLTEDTPGNSGHSQVSGKEIDEELGRPDKHAVWELFTREQLANDLFENATKEDYMSATPFLTNPDFSRNYHGSGQANSNNGWNNEKPITYIRGYDENYVAYAEGIEFDINQTITDLPNGEYALTAYGVYYADGPGGEDPCFYVVTGDGEETKKTFTNWPNVGYTELSKAGTVPANAAKYRLDTIKVKVWDNKLKVGFRGGRTDVNAYFDNVQILYYGPIRDLQTLNSKYTKVRNSAANLKNGTRPMSIEAKENLQTALNNVPNMTDAKEVTKSIAEMSRAIANAKESITLYSNLVKKYEEEFGKLTAEAQAYYNDNIKVPIIDAGLLKNEEQLSNGLKIAKIIDSGKNTEVTDIVIVNPSFEIGNSTGWSLDDGGIFDSESTIKDINIEKEARYKMEGMDGTHLFNTWFGGGDKGGYPIYQDIPLAAGTYQLNAMMASTIGTHFVHLTANGQTATVASDVESKAVPISLTFDVDDAGIIRFYAWASTVEKVNYEDGNHAWYKVDDFHLIYKGPKDLTELVADLDLQVGNADALLKKAMNADIKLDLQNAKRNGTNVRSGKEKEIKEAIVTLKTCIAAAQKSVTIYENIGDVIKKGQTLDASGTEAFNKFIQTVQTAWSDGTITDGTAELKEAQAQYIAAIKQQSTPGTVMTESVADWECNSGYVKGQFNWDQSTKAIVKDWTVYKPVSKTPLELTPVTTIDNNSISTYFHVNTWSDEADTGADGGTPMVVPFTEFWSAAGDNVLGRNEFHINHVGEIGYRPGRYTIGINARLGQFVAGAKAPTGYKFVANGVDSKTQYTKYTGSSDYWYAFDEIDILVDEDGKLDFGFQLDHPNFSWLTFKLIKLVYQGDSFTDEYVADRIKKSEDKYIGQPMNAEVEEKLKQAIKTFKNEHTITNGKALDQAENDAAASIKLYKNVQDEIQKYIEKEQEYNYNGIYGFDETGHLEFVKKIDALQAELDNRTLTEDNKDDAKNAYLDGLLSQGTGDFTELIVNPGFEQGVTGWTADNATDCGAKDLSNGTYETHLDDVSLDDSLLGNLIFNIWDADGEQGGRVKQTIKGLPNGKYRISAYVASYNDNYVFIFGNDAHSEGVCNSFNGHSKDDAKRHALEAEVEVKVTNKQLTLGAIGGVGSEYPDYPNQKGCWYKVDNFRLEYLGAIDNQDLLDKLKLTIEYANQFIHEPMNKDSLALLSNAYVAAITANANTDQDDIIRIDKELRAYSNHTKSSIEIYKNIKAYIDQSELLDEDGQKAFKEIAGDIIKAYKGGTITDGKEEMGLLEDKLRIATKAQRSHNSDWTGAIYNPSFENRMEHWLSEDKYKPLESVKTERYEWSKATGNRYGYRNNSDVIPVKVKMFQNIDSVASGVYKLRATVYTNSNTMSLFGNDLTANIPKCDSPDEPKEIEQIVVSWDGKRISLGVIGTLMGGEQFRIDNIRLEYVSEQLDIVGEAVPDSVPMNQKIRETQDKMVLAFQKKPQPDNLMNALNAINEAKASAAAYQKAWVIMDSCQKYMKHSNVYTQRAMDYCMSLFNPLYDGWKEGTLTTADIDGMIEAIYQNGFEGFNDAIAKDFNQKTGETYPILYYIFDAWEIDRTGVGDYKQATDYFKINTWSTEVDKNNIQPENSEMTTPFIEYWTNRSNYYLEDATIHGKAINLEPGYLYRLKVLTRVANENRDVAADEYTGITLHVETDRVKENNGRKKEITKSVDVCKGEAHNDGGINVVSQVFQVDSIIVREKDNHDADIYFEVNGTNANWFNWKFCQLDTIRKLYFWEENDLASDEEIKKLRELIARDEQKRIGFNDGEYSTYDNHDIIVAHNAAKEYLEQWSEIQPDGHHRLTKYQVNLYIAALEDESKWIRQEGDVNCVFNPNFWLVQDNYYAELYGWKNHDTSIANPGTGGFGVTCATAAAEFAKFNNIAGSINKDGKENIFSTAAKFVFEENNLGIVSPRSVYYYGEEDGYEMPLDPDQEYSFTAQLGYFTEGQPGSVTFDIVDEGNRSVLDKPFVIEPKICVTDTMKIPETFMFTFHTNKASSNYVNTLANYKNLQKYKLVVKNTDPNKIWTMVISNIKLYRWPNAIMEIKENAHWGTFIAPFNATIPTGLAAFVVTGKDDEAHEYEDPETKEVTHYTTLHIDKKVSNLVYVDEKNVEYVKGEYTMSVLTYIPAHTPVLLYTTKKKHWSIASGRKADERKDQARYYRIKDPKTGKFNNNIYLEGWEGTLADDKTHMNSTNSEDGWYVLQQHDKEKDAYFYQVNENNPNYKKLPNIPANRCYLVDPTFDRSNPTRIRKIIFDIEDAIEDYTSIQNSDNQNQEIEVVGIYSADGTPQKTYKPGINIIKMSNGTTRKKFIK
jgi:hypothetical protein